uniref:RNA polymerase II-associated protein 3 n=1 Tax=Hyaloperonospora arabidopsidis (strain Emoy2) TaxID=559515 RepID=M4BD15_HYAAE
MTKDVTPLELRAKAAASQACLLDLYEWENTVYKEDLAHRRAATAGAAAAFCPPRDARVVGSRSGATISIVDAEHGQADGDDGHSVNGSIKLNLVEPPHGVCQVGTTSLKKTAAATSKSREELEKDDGNAHYSCGDYEAAIESYTYCLSWNPHNAVVLSNRAMAYLKKQEFVRAEDDCTLALEIDPTHVKSYTRRGTARNSLGKHRLALLDFHHAATLDRKSRQIQAQLQSTRELIRTAIKRSPVRTGFSIEVVNENVSSHASNLASAVNEKADRGLQQPARSSSVTKRNSPAPPKSSASCLPQDETLRPVASKQSVTKRSTIMPKIPNNAPSTSYEFNRVWRTFAICGDADQRSQRLQLRADYLRMIEPATLCSVFKTAIESDVLCEIFHVFRHILLSSSAESSLARTGAALFVLAFASKLATVTRFNMTVMFLSGDEKEDMVWVIRDLEALIAIDNDIQEHAVTDLKKLYKLQ